MPSIPPQPVRVLVVDDEPGLREMLGILFGREGYDVIVQPGHGLAVEAIARSPTPFSVILTDLVMPDGSGLDVLTAAKARSDATQVIVMTAYSTVEAAIDAMRRGAYDFITKPFGAAEVAALVAKAVEKGRILAENARLRAQVRGRDRASPFGTSEAARRIADLVRKVAPMRTTVLITGESGTGKELVARQLHQQSDRAGRPFLVVNCGAMPEPLMESELFGHEKGAFTGAARAHAGIFREADGGAVLLDEVGELPAALQVKLLRVLQERRVRPVGGAAEVPVDVRVLAATNRDVEADVQSGRFRQDLYYRLNVIRIHVPPLRDRREDIGALVDAFVRGFSDQIGKRIDGIEADAIRALESYAFPGNVRELENMIERAVALSAAPVIGLGDLPPEVSGLSAAPTPSLGRLPDDGCDLDSVLGEVERRLIVQALDRAGGVRKSAARLLGITFRSLRYRLQKHALAPDTEDEAESEDERGANVVEGARASDARGMSPAAGGR